MATVRTVVGYTFHPNEQQKERLLLLVRRYAELCDWLAEILRANPSFIRSGELLAAASGEFGTHFPDLGKRHLNSAASRVISTLYQNPDHVFVRDGLPIVDLDFKTVSAVLLPYRKISDEPLLHISIAGSGKGRIIVPCTYELRVDENPAKKAGLALLVYMKHQDIWEVRVTANVDEESVARALKAVDV